MIIPSPTAKKRARIEIIPLIDIVFFLLATFVMVSLSMVKNQSIGVNLPSAGTGTRDASEKGLIHVSVTERGELYVNKVKVSTANLSTALKELQAKEKDSTIVLHGDKKAFLGRAVFILDEARKLGIKKVAFEVAESDKT